MGSAGRKAAQFLRLLERQERGDAAALAGLRELDPTLKENEGLFQLYQEWEGAFSFRGGRPEALPLLVALARKLAATPSMDVFRAREWGRLVDLRGPVEGVLLKSCGGCKGSYAVLGTSGFYDALGLVCPDCGSAYFKALYDDTATPPCACGGSFPKGRKAGCPSCGSKDVARVREISGYAYFAARSFRCGPGA